ncbi:MAG TPA: VOC family protein [Pyrinomonadaceae bacterium]|nr:VOC family protein [Pyrinomonadaceae bacterium]
MAEHTIPATGTFVWNELSSTDVEAAKKFYAELLGWRYKGGDVEGFAYTEFIPAGGDKPIGGMFQMGKEFGDAPSHWMAYVSVADVDASARRAEELGGKVCVPPTDIPNVGRFCVINDPSGATLSLVTLSGAHS